MQLRDSKVPEVPRKRYLNFLLNLNRRGNDYNNLSTSQFHCEWYDIAIPHRHIWTLPLKSNKSPKSLSYATRKQTLLALTRMGSCWHVVPIFRTVMRPLVKSVDVTSTLKMYATYYPEILISTHKNIWGHNTEGYNLKLHIS
jgi:hypothetical protein